MLARLCYLLFCDARYQVESIVALLTVFVNNSLIVGMFSCNIHPASIDRDDRPPTQTVADVKAAMKEADGVSCCPGALLEVAGLLQTAVKLIHIRHLVRLIILIVTRSAFFISKMPELSPFLGVMFTNIRRRRTRAFLLTCRKSSPAFQSPITGIFLSDTHLLQ